MEICYGIRRLYQRTELRNHKYFGKRECNSLSQLIVSVNHVAKPFVDAIRMQLGQVLRSRVAVAAAVSPAAAAGLRQTSRRMLTKSA